MKNSLRIRNLLYLLLAFSFILLIYKGYQGFVKAASFKKADPLYEDKRFFESEPYFKEAYNNHWISYKDDQIERSYEKLSGVKNELSFILNKAESAYKSSKYLDLINTYKDYTKTSEKDKKNPVFLDFNKQLKTKEKLLVLLNNSKKELYKKMDDNAQDNVFKQEEFITLLGKLPTEAYDGSNRKTTELINHFSEYDKNKYSSLGKNLSFEDLTGTINKEKALYNEIGIDPYWLKDTLSGYEKDHEKEVAALEADQQKRLDELKKAKEAEKAKDPVFQDEIMSVVNDYSKGWLAAYNNLDSSYFVNITPELKTYFEERFNEIRANNGGFIGQLRHSEFDLNSLKYSGSDGKESVELYVLLTLNSASYTVGEDYQMEETSNPWHYTLINNGDGWKVNARKEIKTFNHANTKVFDFGESY